MLRHRCSRADIYARTAHLRLGELARDRRYMGAAPARECGIFLARSDIQHDRGARQYAGKAAAVYAAVLGAAYAHVCRRCM